MRRRVRPVAVLCLLLGLLSGCWDFRALDQRAFALMVGIDKTPAGKYHMSLQIQTHGLTSEKRSGGEKGGAPSVQVLTGEGATLQGAAEQIRGRLARELDLTFLDAIVIGRTAADDLMELDWLFRSFRIPVSAFVTLARDTAETVVRTPAPGYGVPEEYALFSQSGSWSRSPRILPGRMFLVFNRNLFTPLEDPYAPVLAAGRHGLTWEGLAVFREHTLAGFLTPDETVIVSMLLGTRSGGTVVAEIPGEPEAKVSYLIDKAIVSRRVTWEQDRPVLHVDVRLRGDVPELIGMHMGTRADEIRVEAAIAGREADTITGVLRRLQELAADPVGFGELARQAAPYRREVSSGAEWHNAYRHARLDVAVKAVVLSPNYMK